MQMARTKYPPFPRACLSKQPEEVYTGAHCHGNQVWFAEENLVAIYYFNDVSFINEKQAVGVICMEETLFQSAAPNSYLLWDGGGRVI